MRDIVACLLSFVAGMAFCLWLRWSVWGTWIWKIEIWLGLVHSVVC